MSSVGLFFNKILLGISWLLRFILGLILLIIVLVIFVLIKLCIFLYASLGRLSIKLLPPLESILQKLN